MQRKHNETEDEFTKRQRRVKLLRMADNMPMRVMLPSGGNRAPSAPMTYLCTDSLDCTKYIQCHDTFNPAPAPLSAPLSEPAQMTTSTDLSSDATLTSSDVITESITTQTDLTPSHELDANQEIQKG